MARDVVTSTKLSTNGAAAQPAGVAITPANGTSVVHGKQRKTIIVVTNTSGSTRVVTVRRNPAVSDPVPADWTSPAIAATTGVEFLGPFSAHYVQADGSIFLDFTAGHTGVVYAVEHP
jgi:hypothetical protein